MFRPRFKSKAAMLHPPIHQEGSGEFSERARFQSQWLLLTLIMKKKRKQEKMRRRVKGLVLRAQARIFLARISTGISFLERIEVRYLHVRILGNIGMVSSAYQWSGRCRGGGYG